MERQKQQLQSQSDNRKQQVKVAFLFVFIFILLSVSVSAAYTHQLNEDIYGKGQSATFVGFSTDNTDFNDPYEICFYSQTGAELYCESGTVPVLNNLFGATYTIPLSSSITSIVANLTVNSALKAQDSASVVAASNGTLILQNITFSEHNHVGDQSSVRFYVTDFQGNPVTNAICAILASDSTSLTPVDGVQNGAHTYLGWSSFSKLILSNLYSENKNYIVEISCSCSSDRPCYTNETSSYELGQEQVGRTSSLFYIDPWLENVSTVINKTYYTLEDNYIQVCADLTNVHDYREPLEVLYNFRCGTSNNATNRVVIAEHKELRGISANTTQNQCAELKIINKQSIAGNNNSCYAATEVHVLDELDQVVYTYSTTSPMFHLYSDISATEEEGGTFMDALVIFLTIIGYALGLVYCSYQIFYQKDTVVPKGRLWEKVLLYFVGFTVLSCLPLFGYYVSLSSQFTAITPFLLTLSIIAFLVYFIAISYYAIHILEVTARLNEDEH